MPKRTTLPILIEDAEYTIYDNTGDKTDCLIQKTNPIVALTETDMTLSELKLLDAYLSQINTQNPESRYVTLPKGCLQDILGVRLNKSVLSKRLHHLLKSTVTIPSKKRANGVAVISLFAIADAYPNDDGTWMIDMACTQEAMEYFFYPQNIGYIKYRLHNVLNLVSQHSYYMFLHLDQQLSWGRKNWRISVNDLKSILHCKGSTYDQFFRFNGLVLKKVTEEINEKCDIKYTYTPIRTGRKVTDVEIKITSYIPQYITSAAADDTVPPLPEDDLLNMPMPEDPPAPTPMPEILQDHLTAYANILQQVKLFYSSADMITIATALEAKPLDQLPDYGGPDNSRVLADRCLHLYRQAVQMQKCKEVAHPVQYLCKLISSNVDLSVLDSTEMIVVGRVIAGMI